MRRPDRAEVLVEVDRGPLVGAETVVGQGQHRQAAGHQRGAAAGVEVVAVEHDGRQSEGHGQVGEVLGGDRRREQGEPAVGQLPLRERQAAEVAEEHDAQPAADQLLGERHAPDQVTHPGGRARVAAHAHGRPAVGQGGHDGGRGRARGGHTVATVLGPGAPPVPPACTAGVRPVNSARPDVRG